MSTMDQTLNRLAALPGVAEAVEQARQACTELRWHTALRRRTAEAAAEARIRAACASATLEGARFPLDRIRDAARGAEPLPDDPSGKVAFGVLRASSEVERLPGTWTRSPSGVMARLHTAAMAGLLPAEQLGRPRQDGEAAQDGTDLLTPDGRDVPAAAPGELPARLAAVAALVAAPATSSALVVAALVQAELITLRPFVAGNGVVARALCRAIIVDRGLDPTAVAVWEEALLAMGPAYPLALGQYATGSPDGVAHWLSTFGQAVAEGAAQSGRQVCDAVLAGRPA